jgi:hypothetical protein
MTRVVKKSIAATNPRKNTSVGNRGYVKLTLPTPPNSSVVSQVADSMG